MADDQDLVDAPDGEEPSAVDFSRWSNLWQVPAIVLSAALIAGGLYVVGLEAPAEDWDGALADVAAQLEAGQLDVARDRLKLVIEPNLVRATPLQQGRFHRLVAEYVDKVQAATGVRLPANDQAIDEHYRLATELGDRLTPANHERWGRAQVSMGDLTAAARQLQALEAMSVTQTVGEEAARRRNALLRVIVEATLRQGDASYDELIAILQTYREDPLLRPTDEAWALARQSAFELEVGNGEVVIGQLLPAMRRFEGTSPPLESEQWGELYVLLAQAYAQGGRDADAQYHLRQAFDRLPESSVVRADALLTQGRLYLASGEVDDAFTSFDELVRQFGSSDAEFAGRLGRAETASLIGDHPASLADFDQIVDRLGADGPRRGVDVDEVTDSLIDRHDSAIAIGRFDLAVNYANLARRLYDGGAIRSDVLYRLASTSRQMAKLLIDDSLAALGEGADVADLSPEIRHEAAAKYEEAGRWYHEHAIIVNGDAAQPKAYAESLFQSGEAYREAGRSDESLKQYEEYYHGGDVDDARWSEVTSKLAQACELEGRLDEAAKYYSHLIEVHPRSVEGTASHVPLARCLIALDRAGEAEKALRDVLSGRVVDADGKILTPGAADYIDALIALGTIYHDASRWKDAIVRFTAAAELLERNTYPDATVRQKGVIRYRLADALRRYALSQLASVEDDPLLSPTEQVERRDDARRGLSEAQEGFAAVCRILAERDPRQLNRLERQYRRHAWLDRARCAFELENYANAAQLYESAANQFGDHHEALEALVQVVNCYDRLGDQKQADIAHRAALARLRQLPDSAFADPAAVMDRKVWETWLRNRPLGSRVARAEDQP